MTRTWQDSTGREVCDLDFEGSGSDRYISAARYVDDGSSVPDDELEFMAEGKCLCRACEEGAA